MVSTETVTLERVMLLLAMAGHNEDYLVRGRSLLSEPRSARVRLTNGKGTTMKLNHINLYSHDIKADQAMFEHYFGLRTLVVRGTKMAIMQDDDGLVLIVNHFDNKLDSFDYPKQLDILHIGFIQDSRDAVDAMYARLSGDGWETQAPHDSHGAWSFYFRAKGGYFIEVTTLTQVRPEEAYRGDRQ